jgi:hypothetical protein
VKEALADALQMEALERLFGDTVEARRQELAVERRAMKHQMEERAAAQTAEWLQGIDDLAPGSYDLLTVSVLCPALI